MVCYEEHDRNVVHLQKAAPKHWFSPGEMIRVEKCPTRFGLVSWSTVSVGEANSARWKLEVRFFGPFDADLVVHIHHPNGEPLKSTSLGELQRERVVLRAQVLSGKTTVNFRVS